MAEKKERLIIPRSSSEPVRGLYGPLVDKITKKLGNQEITRASHVEPTLELSPRAIIWLCCQPGGCLHVLDLPPGVGFEDEAARQQLSTLPQNKWWADMLPVSQTGPVLGPFDTREAALAAEEQWLHEHHIPVCRPCQEYKAPREPRPYPRKCSKCFQFTVMPAVLEHYTAKVKRNGQLHTFDVPNMHIGKCSNCSEQFFDVMGDDQIQAALEKHLLLEKSQDFLNSGQASPL